MFFSLTTYVQYIASPRRSEFLSLGSDEQLTLHMLERLLHFSRDRRRIEVSARIPLYFCFLR